MTTARRAALAGACMLWALLFTVTAGEWRPEIPSPPGNPLTGAKAELGRHLFFDPRLSGSGRLSCAGCHRPENAFADSRARSVGDDGAELVRGAPPLVNLAWARVLTWADPTIESLEGQARVALFGTDPVEMGAFGREREIVARLKSEPRYAPLFRAAFPGDPEPVSIDNVVRSLASFERTLVSVSSPYDRLVLFDERGALSHRAREGMQLFFSDRAGCAACHSGLALTAASDLRRAAADRTPESYYRTRPANRLGSSDDGLATRTGRAADRGKFRVPTLRNIARTAPYLHDGSAADLIEVVELYDRGGVSPAEDVTNLDPSVRPHPGVRPLGLTADEKATLVAFLESLTDARFLENASELDPWRAADPTQPDKARGGTGLRRPRPE